MIPTYLEQYGWLTAAKSDDGLVAATHVPLTTLSGEYSLVDLTTGRQMWRGEYEDPKRPLQMGTATGERVPEHIWAAAVGLMQECDAVLRARQEANAARAHERDLARYNSLSERIAQDMDREDSDL